MARKTRSKKGWYITDNIIKSRGRTAYIRYSTGKHPSGAGRKKVVYVKRR